MLFDVKAQFDQQSKLNTELVLYIKQVVQDPLYLYDGFHIKLSKENKKQCIENKSPIFSKGSHFPLLV